MLTLPNHILANELIDKMGVGISYISKVRKDNDRNIIKIGNCLFIDTKSSGLPPAISQTIRENSFMDFSDKMPLSWILKEFEVTEEVLFRCGIILEKIIFYEKHILKFSEDFLRKTKGKIPYVLNHDETMSCFDAGQIEGYIRMTNNKYFTWYSWRK